MSLPSSVDYGELETVKTRFDTAPYAQDHCPNLLWTGFITQFCPADKTQSRGQFILDNFAGSAITSTTLLASCVILVVIMLITTHTTGTQYYTRHYQAYCNWVIIH